MLSSVFWRRKIGSKRVFVHPSRLAPIRSHYGKSLLFSTWNRQKNTQHKHISKKNETLDFLIMAPNAPPAAKAAFDHLLLWPCAFLWYCEFPMHTVTVSIAKTILKCSVAHVQTVHSRTVFRTCHGCYSKCAEQQKKAHTKSIEILYISRTFGFCLSHSVSLLRLIRCGSDDWDDHSECCYN